MIKLLKISKTWFSPPSNNKREEESFHGENVNGVVDRKEEREGCFVFIF